ncbi:VCBS repeat-containing protein [Arundinibacter roseus]|uniref:RNA-binding protein n=1 Tax=Arundinibacter roseus TaxID=2070510 RepID=A0A4R4K4K2_9BACT|nr:VCBS repeat-containing protein [Arundinibacter roseus]TDB62290.1 RNA-binding protein [Arundinibacter roseus]
MRSSTLVLVAVLAFFLASCREKTLFTLLPASETGITFANRISENDTMNIIDFEYIYNGGGVGIADMNGDSLPDIIFSGNQVDSRIFLNKGGMKFTDISKEAGIGNLGRWCSGVSLVDINADGRMDIYLSATTFKTEAERRNLLFINQGNTAEGVPTFKEMAAEYGVADTGHSMQAAFFDYDNDGDLDLYILIDTIEEYPNLYRAKRHDGSSITTDRLYRCDWDSLAGHPVYTNVSKEAGIQTEGYGLGINITDFNQDGFKDIYVTNDYLSNDLLYINNGDGTFTDRAQSYFKHTSNSAMGNDVADINNDGLMDVVVLDMLPRDNTRKKKLMPPNSYQGYLNNDLYGFMYEYVRNTMQINMGNKPGTNEPIYSELGMLADVAETDWSWTPMLADFNNDGWRDLIVTNGFPRDVTDRDFAQFRQQSGSIATWDYLVNQIPTVKIRNYAFQNKGDLTFQNVSEIWGFTETSFSNGAAYGDLDGDGDLDLVVNNINDSAFVYKNNLMEKAGNKNNFLRIAFQGTSPNLQGLGARVDVFYKNGATLAYEHSPYRGYLSTVEPIAHFGLGEANRIDSVRIIWPNRKQQVLRNVSVNQKLIVRQQDATQNVSIPHVAPTLFQNLTDVLKIDWMHEEPEFIDFNGQKLLPHKLSQYPPALATADINGDGLEDIFIGGSRQHKGRFFIQKPDGTFSLADLLPGNEGSDKESEDMGVLLFDADGDGDNDLYIASGSNEHPRGHASYQDRLYLNDGTGKFTAAPEALPLAALSTSCVRAADIDQDGDLDLFVGGRVDPEHYPRSVGSTILLNESTPGKVRFVDATAQLAPELAQAGLICDALWTDYNQDGAVDLIVAGEWMPLKVFQNKQGKLTPDAALNTYLSAYKGFWNSIVGGDFDNDGDIDYVVGNLGLNTIMRTTDTTPLTILADDFNQDGSFDAIPMVYYPTEEGRKELVPFHGREDMIKQLIPMRARYQKYDDFAKATFENLFPEEQREKAIRLEANYLQSAYLENLGQGKFKLSPLPTLAQVAPINGMLADDFDGDGYLDVLLVANDFGNEVSVGRFDASNGLLLKGDGKGSFRAVLHTQSGFYVPGNAKALVQLPGAKGQRLLVATQNRGKVQAIGRIEEPLTWLSLKLSDASALLHFTDGTVRKHELYYGASFLSQSSRQLALPARVKSIDVTNFSGKTRRVTGPSK